MADPRPPALLIRLRRGNRLYAHCELATGGEHLQFIAQYVDGLLQEEVFGVLPRVLRGQFLREVAFSGLKAVISKRAALVGRVIVAGNIVGGAIPGFALRLPRLEPGFLRVPFLATLRFVQ